MYKATFGHFPSDIVFRLSQLGLCRELVFRNLLIINYLTINYLEDNYYSVVSLDALLIDGIVLHGYKFLAFVNVVVNSHNYVGSVDLSQLEY